MQEFLSDIQEVLEEENTVLVEIVSELFPYIRAQSRQRPAVPLDQALFIPQNGQ
jgi:hypothetical protein